MITLLRNAALKTVHYQNQLMEIRNQNIDITNFEADLKAFKEGFARNYDLASRRFKTAIDEIGLKIVANIVMVGAITKITKVISKEAAIKAIEDSVPKGTEEKNIKAFEAGYALVE